MQCPVLIVVLLVLSIDFLQNLMDLLEDVLNPLNESGAFVSLGLKMGRFCLCGGKRKCNFNGSQGLESQPHLKWGIVGGDMECHVVTVMIIVETLFLCTWMFIVVHVRDVHNHSIDDLYLVVYLGVESSGFCELGVQQ